MDLIDKKILCELDIDCRQPLSIIAKKLRIGRNVVAYRIKKLEENGIIKNYITSINLGALGYKTYKIYIKTHSLDSFAKDFVNKMRENSKVIHFLKTEGYYDYSITVVAKTVMELDDFLMFLKNNYNAFIIDYFVSILVYSRIFKLNKLLLGVKNDVVKFHKYAEDKKETTIDDKDKSILKTISQNANMPIVEISKKTKLSADIIKYRIKNMRVALINSFRIIFDIDKLGFYRYIIMLKMKQTNKFDEAKILEWCQTHSSIIYYNKRIGNFDFEINIAVKDLKELNLFINNLKSTFGELINNYETILNTELLKLNYFPVLD